MHRPAGVSIGAVTGNSAVVVGTIGIAPPLLLRHRCQRTSASTEGIATPVPISNGPCGARTTITSLARRWFASSTHNGLHRRGSRHGASRRPSVTGEVRPRRISVAVTGGRPKARLRPDGRNRGRPLTAEQPTKRDDPRANAGRRRSPPVRVLLETGGPSKDPRHTSRRGRPSDKPTGHRQTPRRRRDRKRIRITIAITDAPANAKATHAE